MRAVKISELRDEGGAVIGVRYACLGKDMAGEVLASILPGLPHMLTEQEALEEEDRPGAD